MVEGDAGFHPAVLVEDVGVEPGVHSLSGSAGGEGAASSEEGLEGGQGVDVVAADGEAFEGDVDVGEGREVGVEWWRLGWEGKETACVVRWGLEVGEGQWGGFRCGSVVVGVVGEERFLRKGILDSKDGEEEESEESDVSLSGSEAAESREVSESVLDMVGSSGLFMSPKCCSVNLTASSCGTPAYAMTMRSGR